MRAHRSRAALRLVVAALGLLALVMGSLGVIGGTPGVRGPAAAVPNVDSEFRFFAAWFAGAGLLLLHVSRRVERETTTIRILCAALVFGACGRLISIAEAGRPDRLFLTLAAIEFLLAVVIVPWQAAIARGAR